jgi:hypothetical protein
MSNLLEERLLAGETEAGVLKERVMVFLGKLQRRDNKKARRKKRQHPAELY